MLPAKFDEASAQYRSLALQSEIERADPHRLVAMLYEELMVCIDVLTVRAQTGERLTDDPQAHRARSIILSLRSGLDFAASDLAAHLDGLYAALGSELDQRLARPQPERISELGSAVETLAHAWRAIAAS
jgi:flagellar protein FliS